jgi:glycerol uptake facilitator-like aquaporin
MRFVLYCVAQLTGAIAAAGIVLALTPGPLSYEYVPRLSTISLSHRFPLSTGVLKL